MISVFDKKQPQQYDTYVDIYKFFNVLYDLINKMGILKTDNDQDNTKITFINAYPDTTYENSDLIIYDITGRKYFVNNSSQSNYTTTQVRPLVLEEKYDLVTGQLMRDIAFNFENEIELSVWSTSSAQTSNLVQLVESIILKNKSYLRQYVSDVIYVEQTRTVFIENYFKKRLFTKTIRLKVITKEVQTIAVEELQKINLVK
jgi:hypothetical protein